MLAVIFVSIIVFLTLLVVTAGISVVYGITLSVLWNWFMVPILHLPVLGPVQAVAISLVISYMTYREPPAEKSGEKKTGMEVAAALFKPIGRSLGVLLTGWIIRRYFM